MSRNGSLGIMLRIAPEAFRGHDVCKLQPIKLLLFSGPQKRAAGGEVYPDLGYVLTFRQQCRFHIGLAQESKADVTRSQEGMGLYTNVCQQILSPGQNRRSGLLVLCLNLFEYIYYCTHIS